MKNTGLPIFIIYTLFFLFLFSPLYSQDKLPNTRLEISTYAATGNQNPFWFVSNQYGRHSLSKNGVVSSLMLNSQADTSNVFDINYGFEIISNYDGSDNMWFNQAYLQLDYKDLLRLSAGFKEETLGNEYTPLSTGSIIWSSNARPMPKIELGTPGYVKVPYTNDWLEIKGGLTHGWFESNRHVEGVLLHQKYLGIKTGWDLPISLEYVFHHFAQWGGEHSHFGKLPSSFNDYLRVFFVQSADEGAPEGWQLNKIGNHLGSRNYGIYWTAEDYKTGVYHQDIFEDGSGMRRRNFPDGLWGWYLKLDNNNAPVSGIVYEYLQTTDQSGPVHSTEEGLSGDDNYFNHGTYQSGWTHYNMTIGTPFITSPLYTIDTDHPRNYRIWNNRVTAHHFGIKGSVLEGLKYRALISYSKNEGVYGSMTTVPEVFEIETPRYQWSWLLDLHYDLPTIDQMKIGLSMAGDTGKMYGDNWGLMLKVSYTGGFFKQPTK